MGGGRKGRSNGAAKKKKRGGVTEKSAGGKAAYPLRERSSTFRVKKRRQEGGLPERKSAIRTLVKGVWHRWSERSVSEAPQGKKGMRWK